MDDDDRGQSSFERLLDIANRALSYLLIGLLIGKVLVAFTAGTAFEPIVVRVAVCIVLAIVTALAIDRTVMRLHGGCPDRKDVSAS